MELIHCEEGADYRAGKVEVTASSRKLLRICNDELKRLGFHYNKTIRVDGVRGGWVGFRMMVDDAEWLGGEVTPAV